MKFHDADNKARVLLVSKTKANNDKNRHEFYCTQKYFKINRWVGNPNSTVRELHEVQEYVAECQEASVDVTSQLASGYLMNTYALLYAEDLSFPDDCLDDFGVPGSLDNKEWYKLWQPKALEFILEEMLCEIGHNQVTVREGIHHFILNVFFFIYFRAAKIY